MCCVDTFHFPFPTEGGYRDNNGTLPPPPSEDSRRRPDGDAPGGSGGGEGRDRVQTRTVAIGGNRRMPSGERGLAKPGNQSVPMS